MATLAEDPAAADDHGLPVGRNIPPLQRAALEHVGETVPPASAYITRTPPNPKSATKLSTLESYVLNAEADTTQSTDWVQFVFHRVCDKSTGGHCGAYSISLHDLSALLDFLQGEINAGRVVVQTTAQVVGGPLNPACHWDTGGTGCIPPAP